MKKFSLLVLLLLALVACAPAQEGFDDPNDEQPTVVDPNEAAAALGGAEGEVDSWHNILSDYLQQIDHLEGFANDVAEWAAGDPNEDEVIELLNQGDLKVQSAGLYLDLGSIHNASASIDVQTGWGHLGAGAYAAALASATEAEAHLADRAECETGASTKLDEAFDCYFEASMLIEPDEGE